MMGESERGTEELTRENEALRAALRALEESSAFNRALVASIPQQLFLKDRDSVYLAVNERYATSLGCESEQVVGKDDFAFFPPDLAEKYRADDRAVMESGRESSSTRNTGRQGKEYWHPHDQGTGEKRNGRGDRGARPVRGHHGAQAGGARPGGVREALPPPVRGRQGRHPDPRRGHRADRRRQSVPDRR